MMSSRGMGNINPAKVRKKAGSPSVLNMRKGGSAKAGLYENIHKKRARIAAGSGEKMRKVGAKGAPTAADFRKSAKTAKSKK